ncbi:hypothetical protein ASH00_12470 [Arthrobacter sp. Soil782]|uniref:hypothetical protein n=1 Tax=Arthrobacter sp. Soil782 TaxID=1736410 RepID=UPI0006F42221|nr:hypothetical protein [Arthrobacter sp. Soil782]KRF05210.1 hypothetical protein ASH00_12470 [Arthrobacter sp. Soil782]
MQKFTRASIVLSLSLAATTFGAGGMPAAASEDRENRAASPALERRTPIPEVTLLPTTADSYPFGGAEHQLVPEDLSKQGYVE